MNELIKSVEELDYSIGIVYDYDINTRELEVFIPKLMPGIVEGQSMQKTLTNASNLDLNINYQHQITTASTISVRAKDKNEPLPDKGSKVMIKFIDNNILFPVWETVDLADEYKVIEEEKYKKLYTLKIGDFQTDVYEDDVVEIKLPENFTVIKNFDNKNKVFDIRESETLQNKLKLLEEIIGNDTYTDAQTGDLVESKGLLKNISYLFYKVKSVENELYQVRKLLNLDVQYSFAYTYNSNTYNGTLSIIDNSNENYYVAEIKTSAGNVFNVGNIIYINPQAFENFNTLYTVYKDVDQTPYDAEMQITDIINSTN